MTIESAQTNFTGQKGWNDLTPEALGVDPQALRKGRGKVRPRRVVTPAAGLASAPPPPPQPANVILPGCPPPPARAAPAHAGSNANGASSSAASAGDNASPNANSHGST